MLLHFFASPGGNGGTRLAKPTASLLLPWASSGGGPKHSDQQTVAQEVEQQLKVETGEVHSPLGAGGVGARHGAEVVQPPGCQSASAAPVVKVAPSADRPAMVRAMRGI